MTTWAPTMTCIVSKPRSLFFFSSCLMVGHTSHGRRMWEEVLPWSHVDPPCICPELPLSLLHLGHYTYHSCFSSSKLLASAPSGLLTVTVLWLLYVGSTGFLLPRFCLLFIITSWIAGWIHSSKIPLGLREPCWVLGIIRWREIKWSNGVHHLFLSSRLHLLKRVPWHFCFSPKILSPFGLYVNSHRGLLVITSKKTPYCTQKHCFLF